MPLLQNRKSPFSRNGSSISKIKLLIYNKKPPIGSFIKEVLYMSTHKFNLEGNKVRVIPSNEVEIRADDPRLVPAPRPAPAPPKQK